MSVKEQASNVGQSRDMSLTGVSQIAGHIQWSTTALSLTRVNKCQDKQRCSNNLTVHNKTPECHDCVSRLQTD